MRNAFSLQLPYCLLRAALPVSHADLLKLLDMIFKM